MKKNGMSFSKKYFNVGILKIKVGLLNESKKFTRILGDAKILNFSISLYIKLWLYYQMFDQRFKIIETV